MNATAGTRVVSLGHDGDLVVAAVFCGLMTVGCIAWLFCCGRCSSGPINKVSPFNRDNVIIG